MEHEARQKTIDFREQWLHQNPEALTMVDRGIADAEAGRTFAFDEVMREAGLAHEEAPRKTKTEAPSFVGK